MNDKRHCQLELVVGDGANLLRVNHLNLCAKLEHLKTSLDHYCRILCQAGEVGFFEPNLSVVKPSRPCRDLNLLQFLERPTEVSLELKSRVVLSCTEIAPNIRSVILRKVPLLPEFQAHSHSLHPRSNRVTDWKTQRGGRTLFVESRDALLLKNIVFGVIVEPEAPSSAFQPMKEFVAGGY